MARDTSAYHPGIWHPGICPHNQYPVILAMEMNRKTIVYTITLLLGIVMLLVFLKPQTMISPGRLVDGHVEFGEDCFACHTLFRGSTAEKCITCHKVAEIGIKTTKGMDITGEDKNVAFHQKLLENECTACHSDHQGVMIFRPVRLFSHRLLKSDIQNKCDDCHIGPDDTLHRKIKGNCGQCHTSESWKPASFEHDKYFRLDRDHDAKCSVCHVDDNYSRYTCYGCHEHSRSGVRHEHREEGIFDFESCVECHRSADEDEAERIWKQKRRQQGRTRHDDDD